MPLITFLPFPTMLLHSSLLSFHCPLFLNHKVFRQISSKFSTLNKMSKRNNKSTNSSQEKPFPVNENFNIHNDPHDKPLSDTSQDNPVYIIIGSIPVSLFRDNMNNHSLPFSTKSFTHKDPELMSRSEQLPSPPTSGNRNFKRNRVDLGSVQTVGDNCGKSSCSSIFGCNSSLTETSPTTNFTTHRKELLQRSHFWKKKKAVSADIPHSSDNNLGYASADRESDSPVSFLKFKPYDICFRGKRNSPLIGSALIDKSEEIYIERQTGDIKDRILRPGMVLLKNYISHDEQVYIVRTCRKLGLGHGGFYQPGFASGVKLRLKMMCLGLDWDPQTKLYGNKRVIDGSQPPSIPYLFTKLVIKAIKDAHCLIKKECGVSYVEDILPSMSPDICIVNFYTTNGRLGLHQDRDESKESLRKGLPIVSFCIGDSAEFLYGDHRDVENAENVLLESGDVLIFGGESRHVFHGVSSIIPDSAPIELLQDTRLLPGRLNLTFRQY
ncbi:hypothetical protein Lal_00018777 [Lupinus albus]|uniref:DNA N(6)-methyladenine demethylase n=1 Tax=Lupinus albus TaxID=3870 RepID=A0A6A4PNH3_LUPAL|nr:putative DNA oxidative demethylase [Lupinus albus]KAF1868257.1 hypothetical protein Lal_00018777 [Lupinus albus]